MHIQCYRFIYCVNSKIVIDEDLNVAGNMSIRTPIFNYKKDCIILNENASQINRVRVAELKSGAINLLKERDYETP